MSHQARQLHHTEIPRVRKSHVRLEPFAGLRIVLETTIDVGRSKVRYTVATVGGGCCLGGLLVHWLGVIRASDAYVLWGS